MALISEHRRNNIFKVAGIYLIGAWVLLQVLDVVTPYLHLPERIGTITIVAIAIGFPVICVVATLFEVTSRGLRKLPGADSIPARKIDPNPAREDRRTGSNTGPAGTLQASDASSRPAVARQVKRLAVLPMSNIIDDPDTNFLGFALADQIIGAMSYSRNVLVRPSSSIRQYQNELLDLEQVGAKLKVDYILAGNFLKEQDTIRLNIELVEMRCSELIWRESIEIAYQHVFELQDRVSRKVVHGLKVQLSTEERQHMKVEPPNNAAVYELYLRAVSYPFTVDDNDQAMEILKAAIKLDPEYAPLHLELGVRFIQMAQIGKNTRRAQAQAEESFVKALSLKEDFLPVLANLGMLYTDCGRHEEAHSLLTRALAINPNEAWLHFALSYHYRYIGLLEKSTREVEIALAIDPGNPQFRSSIVTDMYLGKNAEILQSFDLDLESPFTLNYLGEVAFRHADKDLAAQYFNQVLAIKNELSEYYFAASFLEYLRGNTDRAISLNRAREIENPADSEIWYEVARLYGLYGADVECCRALKKAIAMGYVSYPAMQVDTFLDPVRNQPEIQRLIGAAQQEHQRLKAALFPQ